MNKLKKFTLIIDGNYFLQSRLYVTSRSGSKRFLDSDIDCANFIKKLSIDIASEVRKLGNMLDNIVFTVDSKQNWRKDLYSELEYKGNRKQSDDVNWQNFMKIYDEFCAILKSYGVTINKLEGAEADDIIYGWSVLLSDNNKNGMIWTGDKDLIQLVNSLDNAHIVWFYNTHKTLHLTDEFNEYLTKESELSLDDQFFNMGSDVDLIKDRFNKWISTNNVKLVPTDPEIFILKKILMGDKSDNIKPVVNWLTTNKNKKVINRGISETLANKIINELMSTHKEWNSTMLFNTDIKDDIVRISIIQSKNGRPEEVRLNLENNIGLMLLHHRTIPLGIVNEILKTAELSCDNVVDVEPLRDFKTILKNTDYLNSKTVVVDPFRGMDIPETPTMKPNQLF